MTGILLELFGLYLMVDKDEVGLVAVVIGLGLLCGFYLTRRTSLVIHAGNLRIQETVTADNFQRAVAFLHDVERLMMKERGLDISEADVQKLEQKHKEAVSLTEAIDELGLR